MPTLTSTARALWAAIARNTPGICLAARKAKGSNSGLEMIEYIVMAGLVVAALVVVVAVFGDAIGGMFHSIALAFTGQGDKAKTELEKVQSTTRKDMARTRTIADDWSSGD